MMTEDRLISANEALRMILNSKTDRPCLDTIRKGVWDIAHDCAISCVDACPTVDAVEVVHGWWIWKDGKCFCSACSNQGEPKCVYQDGAVDEYPYCPECGAKMDLEEDSNDD